MRRTLTLATLAALSLVACGGSDSSSSTDPTGDTIAEVTGSDPAPVGTDTVDTGSAADAATDTTPADPAETCIPDGGAAPEPEVGDAGPPPTDPDKPEVELPTEAPTELGRTVLTEGSGEAAAEGDTVIVDYVGVRSDDGLEFDNSFDRGEPFPVPIGRGNVIEGWDEGLVDAQAGERLQLDIPAAQAYGETARPPIICENEDLSFVIDVRAVVKPVDPAEVPTEPGVDLSTGDGVDTTTFEELDAGDGETIEEGDTAVIRFVNFNAETGEAIETNWSDDALQIPFDEEEILPGLFVGMEGMNVGGRRAITIPPDEGFGAEGVPESGLPADTDMIFLIELVGTY